MIDLAVAKATGVGAVLSACAGVVLALTDAVAISGITSVAAVIMAAVSAYFAYRAKVVAEDTHKEVNSRMDKFLKVVEEKSLAEGKLQGKAEANVITDAADKVRAETRKDLEAMPKKTTIDETKKEP